MKPSSPVLYQLASQSPSQMMGYVFQSRDGSLIVLDGGCKEDADHLLALLKKLGGVRPHISLWLLSHPHFDHIGAFLALWQEHWQEFLVDKVCCKFPAPEFLQQYEPQYADASVDFAAIRGELGGRLQELAVGDRPCCGDFSFEVLFTAENPCKVNAGNNVSVVLRAEVLGCRLLFPGDLGQEVQDVLLARPEALKADIVQMAHHGQSAVTKEFYAAAAPKLCLWPTPDWLWRNDAGKGSGTGPWTTLETRRWIEELGVQHHLVSKDGDSFVTFLGDGRFEYGSTKDTMRQAEPTELI